MNIFHKCTIESLKRNKSRTIATIIGIILSVALSTAIMTSALSMKQYGVDAMIANAGDWYGLGVDVTEDEINALKADDRIDKISVVNNIGCAKIEMKSYSYFGTKCMYIAQVDEETRDNLSIRLVSGRMPENSSEIVVPERLLTYAKARYKVGDVITLESGIRNYEGKPSWQWGNESDEDTYESVASTTYTIVGIMENSEAVDKLSDDYTYITAFTDKHDASENKSASVYFTTKNAKDIYDIKMEGKIIYNKDLLRFMGQSQDKSFMSMMYGLVAILIGIVVAGSVSLIYNSFAISVSERTRQFGLLSSIGATKRQLRMSVIYEALVLCVVSIPLGLVVGIAGAAVTFKNITSMLNLGVISGANLELSVHFSLPMVLVAIAIGIVTVVISAIIPAIRAGRLSAIDAIRQAKDVRIKNNKVNPDFFMSKLFGFEGMLASKNSKRNKKKYRATVISLVISIVLFVAASNYTAYLKSSLNDIVGTYDVDVMVTVDEFVSPAKDFEKLKNRIATNTHTGDVRWVDTTLITIDTPEGTINEEYISMTDIRYEDEYGNVIGNPMKNRIEASLVFVEDEEYKELLKMNNLDVDKFTNTSKPLGVQFNTYTWYDAKEAKKYITLETTNKDSYECTFDNIEFPEGYTFANVEYGGDYGVVFTLSNSQGEEIKMTKEELTVKGKKLNVGATIKKLTDHTSVYNGSELCIIYPASAKNAVVGNRAFSKTITFKTEDHKKLYNELIESFSEDGYSSDVVVMDITEDKKMSITLIKVIDIFAYSFIVIISLISVANVFNTITTSIYQRRREIAMLKSVGMTHNSLKKMMRYECLTFGVKALLLGIPLSLGMTGLIYKTISEGWMVSFFIDWKSFIIAILVVFIVVFATMTYAVFKIRNDNTVETLKSDNL